MGSGGHEIRIASSVTFLERTGNHIKRAIQAEFATSPRGLAEHVGASIRSKDVSKATDTSAGRQDCAACNRPAIGTGISESCVGAIFPDASGKDV